VKAWQVNAESRVGRPRLVLQIVGATSSLLSLVGLWFDVAYLMADYSCMKDVPPYFFQVHYTMAGIDIALLIAGVVLGIVLMRGIAVWAFLLIGLQLMIVLKWWVVGGLWLDPTLGRTIATATGSSGGTIVHLVILFPIWGSVAALWAYRRVHQEGRSSVGV
jgi:hypothetical protein